MLSKSILFLLASSLLASTGSASPLESEKTSTEKVGTEEVRLAITENPAMTFATYDNRWCGSGQHDYANPDGGCYTLPGQGMQVWWFANTCRTFIYKDGSCTASSGELQVHVGQCYDIGSYHSVKVFCH